MTSGPGDKKAAPKKTEPDAQVRLLCEISAVHRDQSRGLDKAGRFIVDTLFHYLKTPIVGLWEDADGRTLRWTAGEEGTCRSLLSSVSSPASLFGPDQLVVQHSADDVTATVLRLKSKKSTAAIFLANQDDSNSPFASSEKYWECLATTAEAALHSAHLLEENRRERTRLRAVLEHIPTAVLLFDSAGNVVEFNRKARLIVERPSWDRLGQDDHPFTVCDQEGEPLPREEWPLFRALNNGEQLEDEEFVLDFGDGKQRTISLSIVPVTDDTGQATSFLVTGTDVTKRSEMDRRKDEFLSVASHELRSPLTPLAGFIHLCRQQAEAGREVDPEVLRRAENQVGRLRRLIEDLLDMSRLETGKLPIMPRKVKLKRLIKKIMDPWLRGDHGERICLTLPEGPVEAWVDPDRIDQVLTNVVDNAVKHGRADGEVQVVLDRTEEEIILTVGDEGDGIPPEVIDRVFDRYFFAEEDQRRTRKKSMGIGLYLSRQIVEEHGGRIAISSNSGQPTVVTITLPVG